MPIIRIDDSQALREKLDDLKDELVDFQERNRTISKTIKDTFTEDGAITMDGLEARLKALDVLRRGMNPLDTGEQCLIQGQQNEIAHLMQLEKTLLHEKANILERVNELENQVHQISTQLQQGAK